MRFGVGFKVLVWVRVSAIMVRGVDGFQLGLFHHLCTPNDSDARKCAPFPCTLSLANPNPTANSANSCAQAGGRMYVYGLEVRGLELFLGLGLGLGFFGVWGFGVGVSYG